MGRVNSAGFKTKGNCSGTLIAPDVVLTAAHCVPGDPNLRTTRTFVAGYRRGEYLALRNIRAHARHPAYSIGGRHDPRFDLGLLFLDAPITEVAPVPLADEITAESYAVLGYHQVTPHMLTGRLNCPLRRQTGILLDIGCPVISGNSGGPVLAPDGAGGWQVVAVVSSRHSGGALAVRISHWVRETMAEPPEETTASE